MDIETKDELLEQISLAVEQIQKRYVEGSDVIMECQETKFLCKCMDEILHHGLKDGLISRSTERNIWPLLQKITCAEDVEEINRLCLKTDKEKCSAWIRMAVNLNLLGSYISALSQDKSLLSNHYYDFAFLRDPVTVETVKSLLNYGIGNFDFQISVNQKRVPEHSNDVWKQETLLSYASYDHEKVNGNEFPKMEFAVKSKESLDKKKRKKKKQSIHTVVITDLDNHDGPLSETSPESEGMPNSDSANDSQKINGQNFQKTDVVCETADVGNKPSEQFHRETLNCSTFPNSKATLDELVVNQNGDMASSQYYQNSVQTNVVTEVNGNVSGFYDDIQTREDKSSEQVESLGLAGESEGQRGIVFGVSEIEEYMRAQSSAKKFQKPEIRNSIPNGENVNGFADAKHEAESNGPVPRNSFSTTDFHLEDSNESSYHSSDRESDLTSCQSNKPQGISNSLDSRNSKKSVESINLQSRIDDSGSDKCSSARADTSTNDSNYFTGISEEKGLDYRVRKVESADFVSTSYGSSFSDVTDASYDDRDLNFIPGIHTHRLSTSYRSGSSYDRRSTFDSSVSFDENGLPVFDSSHYTQSPSSRHSSFDDANSRSAEASNEWDMFDDLLNLEEEHFSGPESFGGLTTCEELEIAIEHYKKMINAKKDKSMDRDELVQKLVKLRLRLQQEKDGPPVVNPKFRKILSHHFSKEEEASGTKYLCDQCGKPIWTLWRSLFTCKDCGYHCHRKCLDHIQRPCPNRNLSSLSYILDISPDSGLDAQLYRCGECRKAIGFSKTSVSEARFCDYTGQYFCDQCHWNDQVCIPARVLHNWDFLQHKVSRRTKQTLDLMKTRPLLNVQQINPMLFRYVEELREVGKLREDILIMKKYFLTCREALESKLLIQLQKRQHFVDNSDMYSFQDLLDLNNDVLLPEISKIHALFLAHIKSDCQLCRARGFICEVCQDSGDVIFAFDPHTVKCTKCGSVFHKICFKPEDCPKCHRRRKVAEKT